MKLNIKTIYIAVSLFSTLFFSAGCNEQKKKETKKPTADTVQNEVKTDQRDTVNKLSSFVLSCGSGCAMTYSPESITGTLPDVKVKFKVEMYEDEKLTDTYNEVYVFSYNPSNQILSVHLDGKADNVLKTLMPDAQRSFREFAGELLKSVDKGSKVPSTKPGQEQTGGTQPTTWRWRSDDKSREFTIKIIRLGTDSLIAQYCAVYNNGEKLDCDFEQNINIRTAFGADKKAYVGTFKSFFNSGTGTCSIVKNEDSLTWKILKVPDGEYYAPDECVLTRKQDNK